MTKAKGVVMTDNDSSYLFYTKLIKNESVSSDENDKKVTIAKVLIRFSWAIMESLIHSRTRNLVVVL